MSIEATIAVMEHATGTDAEWRMLAVLAHEANARGVVIEVSDEHLARRMGKGTRSGAAVKAGLKKSGQLVVLDEGGKNRSPAYWIKLPGLPGPENAQQEAPAPLSPTPSPSSPTVDTITIKGKARVFTTAVLGALGLAEIPGEGDPVNEMIFDGADLLRQGKKVDGKLVTPEEMAAAAAALLTFNHCFEWKNPSGVTIKGSDYGLGSSLKSIVMCDRDRPRWDATKHMQLVESAWRIRWWEKNGRAERRPTPNAIYGAGFENVVQDANDEAGGESPAEIKKKRRYTRG